MDPELKYTNIQLKVSQPQVMEIIDEEPINPSRRESIAIHPTCDCNTCCCYFCCGCPELYTLDEMLVNNSRYTICPLTSKVINPILVSDTTEKTNNPAICLATPGTIIADLVLIIPRAIIHICSNKTT